jgi:hypothetical protein
LPNVIGDPPTSGTLLTPLCISPLPTLLLNDGQKIQITANDVARFEAKITQNGDCWTWTSTRSGCGYGRFSFHHVKLRAHRFAYAVTRGPIPDGLVLDHLCRNRACSNPAHLEAVTAAENVRRGEVAEAGRPRPTKQEIDAVVRPLYGQLALRPTVSTMLHAMREAGFGATPSTALSARRRVEAREPELSSYPTHVDIKKRAVRNRTHCFQGHPYEGNDKGRPKRLCRACERIRWAKRQGESYMPRQRPTHCPQGHAYEGSNIVFNSRGQMSCRECKRESARRAVAKKRAAQAASLGICGRVSGEGNACDRAPGHEGQHHTRYPAVQA